MGKYWSEKILACFADCGLSILKKQDKMYHWNPYGIKCNTSTVRYLAKSEKKFLNLDLMLTYIKLEYFS